MLQLALDYNLHAVTSPMCPFGMMIRDRNGNDEGLARKETTWLINGESIVEALRASCTEDHPHASLMGGRARQAQVYPPALCKAIVRGLKNQLRRLDQPQPASAQRTSGNATSQDVPVWKLEILQMEEDKPSEQIFLNIAEKGARAFMDHHDDESEEELEATDDVHGGDCQQISCA